MTLYSIALAFIESKWPGEFPIILQKLMQSVLKCVRTIQNLDILADVTSCLNINHIYMYVVMIYIDACMHVYIAIIMKC